MDQNQQSFPDRYLVNREDIKEICKNYIKRGNLAEVCSGIAFAVIGACLSFWVSYKRTSMLLNVIFLASVCLLFFALWMKNPDRKGKILLEEINKNARERSDYTAIFLVSRILHLNKEGEPDQISFLTEKHSTSGEVFLLYFKIPKSYEDDGVLNIEKVRKAFANKVEVNEAYIEIEKVFSSHGIKRTSSAGDEKMIRYVFFKVKASRLLQPRFEQKYTWKTMPELLSEPKSVGYNLDVLTVIRNDIESSLGDTFYEPHDYKPIKIIWNITNRCKYNCEICATASERKELTEDQKYKALMNILSLGGEYIRSIDFSGGDPLICDDVINIILRAQSVLGKDKVYVTTTGEGIEYAATHKNNYINDLLNNCEVTIDETDTKAGYIRKENNYYTKSLTLITQKAALIKHLVINVPILRPDMPQDEIRDLVKKISNIKVTNKSCTLIRLMKTGKMTGHYPEQYDPSQFIRLFEKYAETEGLDYHVHCSLKEKMSYPDFCNMLHDKIGIDCSGNVFSCAWCGYISEDVSQNPYYIGNVYNDDLNTILESERALKVKEILRKNPNTCQVFRPSLKEG